MTILQLKHIHLLQEAPLTVIPKGEWSGLRIMSTAEEKFAAKVTELAGVCKALDIPRIMLVRRMTLADPESLKWATQLQLEGVFTVILTDMIQSMDVDKVIDASFDQFRSWLPPGLPADQLEQDRKLLDALCKPLVPSVSATLSFGSTVEPPGKVSAEDLLGDEDEDDGKTFGGFNELLDDTVLRVLRRNLKVLAVHNSARPTVTPPFFNAPAFVDILLPVVQELILPSMHSSRLIKDLARKRDWTKPDGRARLLGVLQGDDDKNNPILYQWDSRWDHFSEESQAALREKNKADPPEKLPWPRMMAHGAKNEYIPADERFLWILKAMLRWESETMAEAWEQLTQMYTQEFKPVNKHEQARENSFRDGLSKWINKMPRHGGEALSMKAFFELPKCDKMFIHKLTQTFGMAAQRQLAVPLLIEMMESLPK